MGGAERQVMLVIASEARQSMNSWIAASLRFSQ